MFNELNSILRDYSQNGHKSTLIIRATTTISL
jgi:hypothetical protein